MVAPDPADVAAASAAWTWWPPEAEVVETEDYLLVRYPDHFSNPTQVLRLTSQRSPDEVVEEVLGTVRAWGRPDVLWWLPGDERPAFQQHLVALGARLDETLDVLARSAQARVDLVVPADVTVESIRTEEQVREADDVHLAVFGGQPMPDERVPVVAARNRDEEDSGRGVQLLARLEDRPVGFGGAALVDGVLRLWGGSVLEEARGRGVYRALLAERLRWGAERKARLALVKGRVQTSGPILRRAGFHRYGEQRSWLLAV
jgi:GNAT superfamily N-acetyltransferase